jgi:hypothetical protein
VAMSHILCLLTVSTLCLNQVFCRFPGGSGSPSSDRSIGRCREALDPSSALSVCQSLHPCCADLTATIFY